MRKRIKSSQKRLITSTRIPDVCIGELARSNESFRASVKVKDNSKPTLKEFADKKLETYNE